MSAGPPQGDEVTVNVTAQIGSSQLRLSATLPTGPTRLDDLVPLLQILSDNIVGAAERESAEQGVCVSCTKGCGACCRQLVPVSAVEARHVARLVANMPEPRKSQIVSRFEQAREKLTSAGLWDKLDGRETWLDEGVLENGMEYFRQGISCPFLEDESCSIHRDRPMTCREYLVTSPAANCAQPTAAGIEWLPLPAKVWVAAARTETPLRAGQKYVPWVPLIQALDWAVKNPEPEPQASGPELLRQVLENLAGSGSSSALRASESAPAATL